MKALQTLINGKSNKENANLIIGFLQDKTEARLTLNVTTIGFGNDGTMYKGNAKADKVMPIGDVRRGRAINNLRKSLLAAFDNKNSKVVLFTGLSYFTWEHNYKQAPVMPQGNIKVSSKGVKFVCTLDLFKKQRNAFNELGDCAVRAIAAGFDFDYNKVHDTLRGLGRRDGGGTRMFQMDKAINQLAGKVVEMERVSMTVRQGLNKLKKGTYIIVVAGHAFTIKDGVIYGNGGYDSERMRARIKGVWAV
jgi:hypothetical protein